jgi:hypothetical protein
VKTTQRLSERTYTCGQCGFTLDRDRGAARNLAALVGEVIGGTSTQSCGATVNEPDGNPHQTHTLWACTATGRPTRSTPRRNATATRTERTHIRSQCSGNGDELYNTYRNDGAGSAMAKFLVGAGMGDGPAQADAGPQDPPSPETLAAMARMQGNVDFFFGHVFRATCTFRPDIAALRGATTRIVVGGGTSKGQVAQRAVVALAEALVTKLVDFPGDHGGFSSDPVPSPRRCTKCSPGARWG